MTAKESLTRLSPTEAWQLLQSNPSAILVDVRSEMEFLMIGHPTTAFHISWIDEPDWTINKQFVPEVRKLLLGRVSSVDSNNAAIILICRSGNRSYDAGQALVNAGVSNISIVEGGFEGPLDEEHHRGTIAGWRFEGLPWEQC